MNSPRRGSLKAVCFWLTLLVLVLLVVATSSLATRVYRIEHVRDLEIVGDELHPLGRVKDFMPYASKIRSSGAQAVLTGNWGNDLTLLIKSARDLGLNTRFYTFYGNALGVPGALGEAGVDRVLAVAEWHPNVGSAASDQFYAAFRQRRVVEVQQRAAADQPAAGAD